MSQSTHFMKLKQINIDLVKEVLKVFEYCTKNSISQETGLSVATCGNILSELLITGEVIELELEASKGGRPARRFVYNENYASVAAVYFRKEGETESMVSVVSNLLGDNIYEHTLEETDFNIDTIEKNIDMLIDKFPNLKVLALGIPGVVHNGHIGFSHFEALAYFPLEEKLMDKYDLLIIAENDMNSTAIGFYESYTKKKPESLAYIYYPKDGISGSGIIVNGQIVKGHSNFAGEVSFLPLPITHEEQCHIQKDNTLFSEYISKVIASINGIINPKKIVLSGYYFESPLTELIKETLTKWVPEDHRPELIFEKDIHDNYVRGLTHLALDQLKCNIQIVER